MAQEGDIIEIMFKWMLEIFGWIFKMLFKLVVWLVKTLFSLLGQLFVLIVNALKKKNNTTAEPEKPE